MMIQVFIYCALYFFMTSAPPQIIGHQVPEAGNPCLPGSQRCARTEGDTFVMVHIFAPASVSCPLSQGPGRLDVDEMAVGRGRWRPGRAWCGDNTDFSLQRLHGSC